MDDDLWIAEAHAHGSHPLACADARRALACALLGLLCLGFLLGPLALSLAQRARMAMADDPELGDARLADAAIVLGKVSLGLHLGLMLGALGWLYFSLPREAFAVN